MTDTKTNALNVFDRVLALIESTYQNCRSNPATLEDAFCTLKDAVQGERKNFEDSCCTTNTEPCCQAA